MSTSVHSLRQTWPRAAEVRIVPGFLWVRLIDGRTLTVPFDWFGFLSDATDAERSDMVLEGDGDAIYWPALDDSVSVPSLLGLPEDPSVGLPVRWLQAKRAR